MRAVTLFTAACLVLATLAFAEKKVVCYYANWTVYHQRIKSSDLDPSLCTHYIYAFAIMKGKQIAMHDSKADLTGYSGLIGLRKKNPSAKIMVAFGGWTDSREKNYSAMASSPQARRKFIDSVVAWLKKYNFDGLDVDWEFPLSTDRASFVLLLKELKERFNQEGGLILSAAVGGTVEHAINSYDIAGISQHLDFINLMTYDMQIPGQTSHQAPLRGENSVETTVNYWLRNGAPNDKLIVGMPMYGKTWTLASASNNGVGVPAPPGSGIPGPDSQEAGVLLNPEICDLIIKPGGVVHFDEQARAAYAVKDNQWVSFDTIQTITEKSNFINSLGLGGAMVWRMETDNPKAECGPSYPLLNTINAVLRDGQALDMDFKQSALSDNYLADESDPPEPSYQPEPSYPDEVPQDNNIGKCTQDGPNARPGSCGFISCVLNGNEFSAWEMECPKNTCFNPISQTCGWLQ